MSHDGGTAIGERRRAIEGLALGAVALAAVGSGYRWVAGATMPETARLWLGPTAVVVAFLAAFLWRHRDETRTADGMAMESFGVANAVTVARGVLIGGVAGFLLLDPRGPYVWLPAVGYGVAVVLDSVDGAVARSLGTESRLGARLDMAVDTTGFLVAPLVAVAWGWLPVWYLSLSAARYCYRAGCRLYRARGGTVGSLPPSRLRRPLSGLQMGFLTLALVPVVPTGVVAAAAPFVLVPSLAVFARDFLAVTVLATEE
ncbi:CDP-alcohol phosphatidyltransferase family protein [Halomicroarcula sp. GCM10025709]|uniref:CDP-alcohol phosphatidyltransferase family protein n=1 Tax=Haloarcula TaxID=2237 RepID=UPI0024C27AEE|nr:CDP-alcohol phosphatidyltransferase family protein [Halomicroarcula sp. YJ-61-S]